MSRHSLGECLHAVRYASSSGLQYQEGFLGGVLGLRAIVLYTPIGRAVYRSPTFGGGSQSASKNE